MTSRVSKGSRSSAGMQPITYRSAEAFLADTKHPQFDCLLLDIQLTGCPSSIDYHLSYVVCGRGSGAATRAGDRVAAPISVAYGAYGRNLQDWVTKARAAGHEVLLQIPLEPQDYPTNDPGPHTLLTTLSHFGRGVAQAARGNVADAEKERAAGRPVRLT